MEVSGIAPLLDTTTSSSGATIAPNEIEQMPINGRNYLDLLQLVPGVAINRQQDPTADKRCSPGGSATIPTTATSIDGRPTSRSRGDNPGWSLTFGP